MEYQIAQRRVSDMNIQEKLTKKKNGNNYIDILDIVTGTRKIGQDLTRSQFFFVHNAYDIINMFFYFLIKKTTP